MVVDSAISNGIGGGYAAAFCRRALPIPRQEIGDPHMPAPGRRRIRRGAVLAWSLVRFACGAERACGLCEWGNWRAGHDRTLVASILAQGPSKRKADRTWARDAISWSRGNPLRSSNNRSGPAMARSLPARSRRQRPLPPLSDRQGDVMRRWWRLLPESVARSC